MRQLLQLAFVLLAAPAVADQLAECQTEVRAKSEQLQQLNQLLDREKMDHQAMIDRTQAQAITGNGMQVECKKATTGTWETAPADHPNQDVLWLDGCGVYRAQRKTSIPLNKAALKEQRKPRGRIEAEH
jgi:hypothetical protein